MKTAKTKLIKLRSIKRPDETFYTNSDWETREVDGVVFLPIILSYESKNILWMKKDSLEVVK